MFASISVLSRPISARRSPASRPNQMPARMRKGSMPELTARVASQAHSIIARRPDSVTDSSRVARLSTVSLASMKPCFSSRLIAG